MDKTLDMGNFEEFEDSSGTEASSAAKPTKSMMKSEEVPAGCKMIRRAEMFALLASWCEQQKEFHHITKLAYFSHVIRTSRAASNGNFLQSDA
jgi:hypothetical protein